MPINEELKRANFEKSARRYLQKGGMDTQEADLEAYYDSTLTHNENMDIIKEQYPLPSNDYSAREERQKSAQARLENIKAELEYKREMKEAERQERLNLVKSEMEAAAEPSELDRTINELDNEPQRKPGLLDSLKGKYTEAKNKYSEFQTTREKEREYRIKQDLDKYEKKAKLQAMEDKARQYKTYSNQNSAASKIMQGLANFGKGGGRGGSSGGLFSQSLRGNSTGIGISALSQGTTSGGLTGLLAGNSAQPRTKGKYITIIENGIARRVRKPGTEEAGPMQPQRGALESMIYSTNKPSVQSGLSGMLSGKSNLTGFAMGRKKPLDISSKGKLSGLSMGGRSKGGFSSGKLGGLSMGKNKKSIWRV